MEEPSEACGKSDIPRDDLPCGRVGDFFVSDGFSLSANSLHGIPAWSIEGTLVVKVRSWGRFCQLGRQRLVRGRHNSL